MADLTTLLSRFLEELYEGTITGGTGVTMRFADGTTAVPTISFNSDPDTGWFWESTGLVGFTSNGTQRMRFATDLTIHADAVFQIGSSGVTSPDVTLGRAAANVWTTPDRFVSTGATAGIGYGTGAGGTVTQATSKSTGVTLNTVTGEITMNAAALAAATVVSFTLTSSAIAAGDQVIIQHVSGGTVGAYTVCALAAGGSATVSVRNNTAGSLSEALVLKYSVFKSVTA